MFGEWAYPKTILARATVNLARARSYDFALERK
jgi:hypothetical protein